MGHSNGFKPGWGPLDGGVRHWTRPDFRRACDPADVISYSGDTLSDKDVTVDEACDGCLILVAHARAVVGD